MTERQKQIRFLKELAGRDESEESTEIRTRIYRAESDDRSLRRVIFMTFVLMLLSLSGLSYARVLGGDRWDLSEPLVRFSCAIGLASVLCVVSFTTYWLWRRTLLNRLYNECRRIIIASLKLENLSGRFSPAEASAPRHLENRVAS